MVVQRFFGHAHGLQHFGGAPELGDSHPERRHDLLGARSLWVVAVDTEAEPDRLQAVPAVSHPGAGESLSASSPRWTDALGSSHSHRQLTAPESDLQLAELRDARPPRHRAARWPASR